MAWTARLRYKMCIRDRGTAESLTGGMIASSVAGVSGASAVLMGGVVSYDPRVKHEVLGVSRQVIDTVGVVSEPCARQMAEGARRVLKVDVAVSATGAVSYTHLDVYKRQHPYRGGRRQASA